MTGSYLNSANCSGLSTEYSVISYQTPQAGTGSFFDATRNLNNVTQDFLFIEISPSVKQSPVKDNGHFVANNM